MKIGGFDWATQGEETFGGTDDEASGDRIGNSGILFVFEHGLFELSHLNRHL